MGGDAPRGSPPCGIRRRGPRPAARTEEVLDDGAYVDAAPGAMGGDPRARVRAAGIHGRGPSRVAHDGELRGSRRSPRRPFGDKCPPWCRRMRSIGYKIANDGAGGYVCENPEHVPTRATGRVPWWTRLGRGRPRPRRRRSRTSRRTGPGRRGSARVRLRRSRRCSPAISDVLVVAAVGFTERRSSVPPAVGGDGRRYSCSIEATDLPRVTPRRGDPDELLTAGQAAKLLHLSRESVYRMIRTGQLRGRHVGPTDRLVRVRRGDVWAYLDEQDR